MSKQQFASHDERLADLIRLAQTTTWDTQAALLHEEEKVNAFPRRTLLHLEEMTPQINRYLALGSLPYLIRDPRDSWVETIARHRTKLFELWPDEWLDQRNKSKPEYSGRLPTLPRGNMRPRYMIIGDAPGIGKSPGTFDRTMTWGPSSHTLRKALLSQNLYYVTWFTNLVKASQLNNAPTAREDVEHWQPFLLREMRELQPKTFILLGNHVLDMFKQVYPVQYALGLPDAVAAGSNMRWIKIPHPSWINRKNISFSEYGDIIKAELVKIDEFY